MENIALIFTIVIAVLLSGMVMRLLPWGIPLPLIQIVSGMIISAVFQKGIELNPEVFFLLFLPPLLFLDGWRIPKDALQRDRLGIFQLAFGLVIITVLVLGYIIHWLIPAMPLAVSFALAAIVSPTDPVAVAGITRKLAVPSRLMHILEGEALFNDASGLVAFRMAVLAAVTGVFSLSQATTSFLWVAGAGLVTGFIITRLLAIGRTWFNQRFGEELGAEILISLLTPFAAYAAAEHIGGSGILAAVAAGLTMSSHELSGRVSSLTRMRRTAIWDTVQFALNGIMFVLLGEQLPNIFMGAVHVVQQTGHHNPWWLIVYALVICCTLIVLRFLWVAASIYVPRHLYKNTASSTATWTHVWILALGGVRGAVTLAGVLTLPLLLPNGTDFPARDLAIFLAATVIIISLIIASIGLPWVLKNPPTPAKAFSTYADQKHLALKAAYEAATQHSKQLVLELSQKNPSDSANYQLLQQRLLAEFKHNLSTDYQHSDTNSSQQIEYQLRLIMIQHARQTIYQLARNKKISDDVARTLVQQLDFDEVRFS